MSKLWYILIFAVFSILGCSLVLPIFDKKQIVITDVDVEDVNVPQLKSTGIFGDDTEYGSEIVVAYNDRGDYDEYQVGLQIYTNAGSQVTISSVWAYIHNTNSDVVDAKACIYEPNGFDWDIVTNGVSLEVSIDTDYNWVEFPYSTEPTLDDETNYLLVILADADQLDEDAGIYQMYQSTGSSDIFYSNSDIYSAYPNFDDPWEQSSITHDPSGEMSLYCEYATVGGEPIVEEPVIEFVGDTVSQGGPDYLPMTLIDAPNGYYTANSQQYNDSVIIDVTCYNATNVKLNYTVNGGSSWSNGSVSFTSSDNENWTTTLTSITTSGIGFSFDVYAYNSTSGLNNLTQWTKKDKDNSTVRRWVKLDCTPSSDILDYNILYFWHDVYTEYGHDNWDSDVQWFDQGTDTSNDSGMVVSTTPTDNIVHLWCTEMVWGWWNKSVCMNDDTLTNVYYHVWLDTDGSKDCKFRLGKDRDATPDYTIIDYTEPWLNNSEGVTTIIDDLINTYSFELFADLLTLDTSYTNLTTNNIYELAFMVYGEGTSHVDLFCNRSANSWIITNLPSNATLNSTGDGDTDDDGLSDWYELYVAFTNPYLTDTDNDGLTDWEELQSGSDPNDFTDTIHSWFNLSLNNDFSFTNTLDETNLIMNNDFSFSHSLDETNLLMNNDFSFSNTLDETNLLMNNDFSFSNTLDETNLLMNNDFSFSHILDETNLIMNNDFSFSNTLDETNLIMNQDFSFKDELVETNLLMNNDFSFSHILDETNLIMNGDFSFSNALDETNLIMNGDFSFSDDLVETNLLMNNNFNFSNTLDETNLLMNNDFSFTNTLDETNLLMNNDFSFSHILDETNLLMNNDFSFSNTLDETNLIMNQNFNFTDIIEEQWYDLIMNQDFSFTNTLDETNLIMNGDFSFSNTLDETNLIMNNDFSFSNILDETNLLMNNDFTFSDIVEWQDLLMNNDFSFSHIFDETNLIMNNDFSFSDTLSETNLIINQDFTFSDIINWNNLIMNQNFLFYATSANLTITNVYPSNNSYSIPLQPYLYATFNSSTGKTMNVSWYYGLTQGNENILIETDTNISNSTQSSLFFIASDSVTTYYWRIWLNDGTNNINETFVFSTEGLNGIGISPRSNIGTLSVLGIFGVLGIIFIIIRRRREYGEDE